MTDTPKGLRAGPLLCVPTGGEAGAFRYIPGRPRLDPPAGQPGLTVVGAGEGGFLACETVWRAADADLAAAEAAIRADNPGLTAIELRIIELDAAQATLTVTPEDGTPVTFGPKTSSGAPAYRVVFSEALDAPQAAAVAAARKGETGRLTLAYGADLNLQDTVAADLAGDLGSQVRTLAPEAPAPAHGGWFSKKEPPVPVVLPDLAACRVAVAAALAAGELTLTRRHGANAPAASRDALEAELADAAAHALHDTLVRTGPDAHAVKTLGFRRTLSRVVSVPFRVCGSADLAGA